MRIAILSDSPMIPTGYRNQALQLAHYLQSQGHEIHYLANAYMGMTLNNATLFDGTQCNFKMYGEMSHSYFRNTMTEILRKNMIDRFIILLDTFMLYGNDGWFLGIDTAPAKTFFWFPSDGGGGLPLGCANILKKINTPVAMSEFGQKQVKDYHKLDVPFIPHGLPTGKFFKMDTNKTLELKNKYGLRDKFVIGVVARNQPRKFLDRTIKTMALVSKMIPNAVLFLHLDPDDPAQGQWKIGSLIKKFNLENRVIFSGMKAHEGIPGDQMNEIYNVMDCFLLTTSGEGFGIPIIEAMACEVPVVATDYTTTPELVINNNAGLGIKLAGTETINMFENLSQDYDNKVMNGTITGSWEVERGICDIPDAANKILYLFNNPDKRIEMGKNGRKAVIAKYDFKNVVGPKWMEILK